MKLLVFPPSVAAENMIVNVMCQLGWATDLSVKIFLDEINTEINGVLMKQITFYNVGGPHPIS